MAFIMDKKQEQAVVTIQRVFRALKARAHVRDLRAGKFSMYADEFKGGRDKWEMSVEDKLKVEQLHVEYERKKQYAKE